MGLITSNATQLHRGGIAEFPSVNKLVDLPDIAVRVLPAFSFALHRLVCRALARLGCSDCS